MAVATDKKSLESQTFTDSDKAADWIMGYNGKKNIYFLVNTPIRPFSGNEHPQLNEIETLDWLHVDIDPRAGEKLEDERERALRILTNPPDGIPPPTAIIFSGGGYQGFWKLTTSFNIGGDPALSEEAKLWNLSIERSFGADSCHNINRIMRLPGTINIPNEKKAAKGRVAETATLVSWNPERVYDLSLFQKAPLVEMGSKAPGAVFEPAKEIAISGNVARIGSLDELDGFGVPDRIKAIIVQGNNRDLEGPKADDSRSSWLFDCLCGLARRKVPAEMMYAIIMDRDFKISESVLDKSNPDRYARRQIGRAIEIVKDPLLGELNGRHAVIENYGGGCVVVEEIVENIGSTPHVTLTSQSFGDFANRYAHRKVQVGTKKGVPAFMPLGKWWLTNEDRLQYHSIVFSPGQETPGRLNLWKGFAVEPRNGNPCDLWLKHLHDNVCSHNKDHYEYLLNWMANVVQRPGEQGHVAVVLRGMRGTGKGKFANVFGSLFGSHYIPVSNSTHMVGKFNAHLRACVVLFADEAFFAGDKQHESVLKALITEPTMAIEGKHKDVVVAKNCTHLILASNESWVVPAGTEERRFFVLDVANTSIQDKAYFSAIDAQMDNGGREALLHMLLARDISGFEVRTAPKTDALTDQQLISFNPTQEWWFQKLDEGRLLPTHENWTGEVAIDLLYEDYINVVSLQRGVRPMSKTTWSKNVVSYFPGQVAEKQQKVMAVPVLDPDTGRRVMRDKRTNVWILPKLEDCRKVWEKRVGKLQWTIPKETVVPEFEPSDTNGTPF